jgi:EmrB/QacA subfamily drug resistance transporter
VLIGAAAEGGGSMSDVRIGTPAGRWVLAASVLGSAVAALDATVVNVALPAIRRDLGGGVSGLQWIITGYLLTLAAFILLGGSLGDRYGRRRVFVVGVVWFALSSLLCGVAPNVPLLAAARALQGVGGALLTPGSLAIIEASFHPDDRGRAIGMWSALGGVATAVGPPIGGWIIGAWSWRFIFLLNLPLGLLTVLVALRHVPETRDERSVPGIDFAGAFLGVAGLAAITYSLIQAPDAATPAPVVAAGVAGVLALVAFAIVEARSPHPMLPVEIFRSRLFTAANVVTFVLYGALGGTFFLFVVHLETSLGYSPAAAGAAMLPVTVIMLLLSARAGALAQRIGPRVPMTVGPLVTGSGLLLLSRVSPGTSYVTGILPGVVVFGLGLAMTVAPLTATVLAAAEVHHAGVASGVNNAVARVGGLLTVAVLPAAAGLSHAHGAAQFSRGFHTAEEIAAAMAMFGGALAWLTIRRESPVSEPLTREQYCAVSGPPLRPQGYEAAPAGP